MVQGSGGWRLWPRFRPANTESYQALPEIPFQQTARERLSTFSVDVDTASYANLRRFIQAGQTVPPAAVRLEEMVNYFDYNYPQPQPGLPFSVNAETAACPWENGHRLVRIGLQGRDLPKCRRPPSSLVFLVDVSGSMAEPNKLPLVQRSLRLLVEALSPRDRVAIVVYAGASGRILPSTPLTRKKDILRAIDSLVSGGSTNGGEGIRLAYQIARDNFVTGGNNRVILATDGDFNVGVTDQDELVTLVRQKAGGGIFLSVLGYGMGNLKDDTMEKLADQGDGNYAYIDTLQEARKVLVREAGGTLHTIAKDVKIQVEFDRARVRSWRLLGYENRQLGHADFANDRKDAGDIGAGHRVTAFYQIEPVADAPPGPLMDLRLRYKAPEGGASRLLTLSVTDHGAAFDAASADFQFGAAVVAYGLKLRHSTHAQSLSAAAIRRWARPGLTRDPDGLRREFVSLVK
jgi:Ca-activated chloride channel family protein